MSQSDWKKCADGVKALLDAVFPSIDINGFDVIVADAIVIRRKARVWDGMTLPGIILSPMDEIERIATVKRNDRGHGVGVVFVQAANRAELTGLDPLQYWRNIAKDTLLNQRIDSARIHRIDNEPRQVVDDSAFSNMYDVTSFTARCWVRSIP